MQIIPTHTPNAKIYGEDIIVRVQDDLDIRMSLHEAMAFASSVMRQTNIAIERSRHVQPDEAVIIAFPSHMARRA